MSAAAAVTAAQWPTVVGESKIPVLVDFWAEWCQPCKNLAPTIDELAAEYEGRVLVVKVNVDEERSLSAMFQIMSIPTLMIFKDGKKVDEIVGQQPKSAIAKKLDAVL